MGRVVAIDLHRGRRKSRDAANRTDSPFDQRRVHDALSSALAGAARCPACGTPIQHPDTEPRPGHAYHCAVCRLDLEMDPRTLQLVLAPLPEPA